MNRQHIEETFAAYADRYDMQDVKVRLKAEHTYRVAALADKIARSLDLSDQDIDLAWLLGMMHDIGRFEQVRRFHTFQDAVSVNHAALSADILFARNSEKGQEPLILQMIPDLDLASEEALLIETAIRLHNVFRLPEAQDERTRMYCDILRDADKVDILKVNIDIPIAEIYDEPEEGFYTQEISEEVMEDVLAHRNVDRSHTRNSIDHIASHISLVFGLVYRESVRETICQGYLDQMLHFPTRNERTQIQFGTIRQEMDQFLKERS